MVCCALKCVTETDNMMTLSEQSLSLFVYQDP
jgi:hypothetical protein